VLQALTTARLCGGAPRCPAGGDGRTVAGDRCVLAGTRA